MKQFFYCMMLAGCLLFFMCCSVLGMSVESMRRAVVKLHVTIQPPDYLMPWQGGRLMNGTGTGFVIGKRRILTNAHVVSHARFLEVQKDGQSTRYPARVVLFGHDCDLAVVTVDDDGFWRGMEPLELASKVPELGDEVTAVGYPLGGSRISLTRGIVSRIDYSVYSHSGIDEHLVLQVDAAINPGNSGGPILYRDRVAGLAFQGIPGAENIGYGIPVPVIRRFLKDIEDGKYDGYPEIGILFMEARNSALRKELGLPDGKTGIVVNYVDPFGAGNGNLRPGDVLLKIDGYPIGNDGTVTVDGVPVLFAELLERKLKGDSITLVLWREKSEQTIRIPLTHPDDPFAFRYTYERTPPYVVAGGLVFTELSRNLLAAVGRYGQERNLQYLHYCFQYAKIDGLYTNRDCFVVFSHRLPHQVNTYADNFLWGVVSQINNIPIRNLKDVAKAFESPVGGFHIIRFEENDDMLVLDAEQVKQADEEINNRYGINKLIHSCEDR